MNKIAAIVAVVVLVGLGIWGAYSMGARSNTPEVETPIVQQQEQTSQNTTSSQSVATPMQANAEQSIVENDVASQAAFLIGAYSKDGKNYLDVDYIENLHGEAAITAKVEDGVCASASGCPDYPNGYKRNQNPRVRTFEVASTVSIEVNGSIAGMVNEIDQTNLGDPYGRKLSISFKKLEEAVARMKAYDTYSAPFKEPKAFIMIDVKNNSVSKIVEPYQQ